MYFLLFKVEAIRNLFAALFLASIGMLIHFKFLWHHVDILLAAVILVIIVKSIVITAVIKAFGYSIRTAFVVSTSFLL
jgi:predicted Kef-type K+ transport protein